MEGTAHLALRNFNLRLVSIAQGLFRHHRHITAKHSINFGNAIKLGLRDISDG